MVQNINLYNLVVDEEKFNFTIKHMVKLGIVSAVVLALVTVWLLGGYLWGRLQSIHFKAEQEKILQQIEKTVSTMPNKNIKEQLEKSISDLAKIKTERQRILMLLSGLDGDKKNKLSAYLTALAVSKVKNVWMTALKIREDKFITLSGETVESNSLPKLIKKISASKVFKGKTFKSFLLEAEEQEKSMRFIIKSE